MFILLDKTSRPLVGRILRSYVRPYAGWVGQSLFWMVLAAAMSATFATLVQPVLDDILITNKRSMVLPVALGVLACFVLRGLSSSGPAGPPSPPGGEGFRASSLEYEPPGWRRFHS